MVLGRGCTINYDVTGVDVSAGHLFILISAPRQASMPSSLRFARDT